MRATYDPESNKIRLYVGRVPRDEYEALRAAGWTSTPKQDCDFAATWTPEREDMALDYLPEGADIEDEDYSPEERSADRAERFEGYRDKRRSEATGHADTFEAGPQAFGHQSHARAQRQANRHDRHRGRAYSQWEKAEYWQARTAAVISHALYKTSPAVRRSRILRLEAEQRKHEKTRAEYARRFKGWQMVQDFAGTPGKAETAGRLAAALVNTGHEWDKYTHPRTGETKSLYSLMTYEDEGLRLMPAEAAELWLEGRADPATDTESNSARWSAHYVNRLTYERAMLAEEGGSAAEADIEPGGWFGSRQVQSVNRSPVTGKVVSVKVIGETSGYTRESGYKTYATWKTLVTCNIERLPEGSYRAPTDAERAEFKAKTTARKAEEKEKAPPAPALINPTDEDAQRLQGLWNARAAEQHKKHARYGEPPVSEVRRMTQAQYSDASRGGNSHFQTSDVGESGNERAHRSDRTTVFKIRTSGGCGLYSPLRVIVLTDKPQKPIPFEAITAARSEQPTRESLFARLGEMQVICGQSWLDRLTDEQTKLLADGVYVGWMFKSSLTQFGFTPEGIEAYKQWNEQRQADAQPAEIEEDDTPAPIGGSLFDDERGSLYDAAAVAAGRSE